jgi:Protein of unknown function (DUF3034)
MTSASTLLRGPRLTLIMLGALLETLNAAHAGDRLLATGGIMQIEGSGGGGLTPWALITGLGTNQEIGASAFCTRVSPQDFTLESCGAAVGVRNRLELSVDRQHFDLGTTVPGHTISQTIVGAKVRVLGDAVVDQDRWWPQVALGAQWKHNSDFDIVPKLLGAKHADGADYYLAATKVWLAGPLGRSWIADLTLRATEANQMGLLGFGGDLGGYHLMAEGSLGVFLNDQLVLGGEYRQKPNNLSAFREQDFKDAFIVFFPVKYLSLTGAYADLGNIANKPSQHGPYVSVQLSW